MKDRRTVLDLVLASASTFVITLALWPPQPARQTLRVRHGTSQWRTYSLAVDDPRIGQLKTKLYRWQTPQLDPRYAVAKWQKETAEFYRQSIERAQATVPDSTAEPHSASSSSTAATARLSDTIELASYERKPANHAGSTQTGSVRTGSVNFPAPETATGAATRASDNAMRASDASDASASQYWEALIASAEQTLSAIEARSADSPVVMMGTVPTAWPPLAFHVALLLALAAACGYMHWRRWTPLDGQRVFQDQPVAVLARLGVFSGMICLGLASAITLWL